MGTLARILEILVLVTIKTIIGQSIGTFLCNFFHFLNVSLPFSMLYVWQLLMERKCPGVCSAVGAIKLQEIKKALQNGDIILIDCDMVCGMTTLHICLVWIYNHLKQLTCASNKISFKPVEYSRMWSRGSRGQPGQLSLFLTFFFNFVSLSLRVRRVCIVPYNIKTCLFTPF